MGSYSTIVRTLTLGTVHARAVPMVRSTCMDSSGTYKYCSFSKYNVKVYCESQQMWQSAGQASNQHPIASYLIVLRPWCIQGHPNIKAWPPASPKFEMASSEARHRAAYTCGHGTKDVLLNESPRANVQDQCGRQWAVGSTPNNAPPKPHQTTAPYYMPDATEYDSWRTCLYCSFRECM